MRYSTKPRQVGLKTDTKICGRNGTESVSEKFSLPGLRPCVTMRVMDSPSISAGAKPWKHALNGPAYDSSAFDLVGARAGTHRSSNKAGILDSTPALRLDSLASPKYKIVQKSGKSKVKISCSAHAAKEEG